MKEFVEYLINSILKDQTGVEVSEKVDGTYVKVDVKVPQEKMGIIIGKNGNVIKSIRALARAKAIKDNVKVDLELVEDFENSVGDKSTAEKQPEVAEEPQTDDQD